MQQRLIKLSHEALSNDILLHIATLALNNKVATEQFHNPIFLGHYNYWLIESTISKDNVTINKNFDVDCVADGIRTKTHNQYHIHQILSKIINQ